MAHEQAAAGRKTNKAFMILSAIGILFVVDSHLGSNMPFFTQIFPYGSFFMPMFAFISGYFFSEKHLQSWKHLFQFICRKVKTLLLPYFLWVVFYGVLTALLRQLNILEIGKISLVDFIQNVVTDGTSFGFNDPAWFVPLLFCVVVGYSFIRKVFGKHWNDTVAMGFFAVFGAIAVALSQTDFRTQNTFMLMKVPCFLQYYHLAVFFRNHLERYFDKASTLTVCTGAVLVNITLLSIYGYEISFPLYATMGGFQPNAPFLPLLTSITGIAFWLKIAKLLVPVLGQSKFVNFISDNTAFIMTHHLAVKHLFIGLLLLARHLGANCFYGIDVQQYRMYAWYTYSEYPWCNTACFLFTVAVLVLLCRFYHCIAAFVSQFVLKIRSASLNP